MKPVIAINVAAVSGAVRKATLIQIISSGIYYYFLQQFVSVKDFFFFF